MVRQAKRVPLLMALRDRVAARPRIAAYLASSRRIPFNEDGIFRHYPELDAKGPRSPK
jgi:glutathione S-transferase